MPPYIQNTFVGELLGNDILTHHERFDVDYNGRKQTIVFYHKKPQYRGRPCPVYAKQFGAFIGINGRFIPYGSIAIDIGAYDGDTTLPIAFLSGKALAFECSASFVTQLNINIGLNPALDIDAYPYAVMPKEGIHQFRYCPTDDNGGAAMTNSFVGTYTVPRLVRAIKLEPFLVKQHVDVNRISFIKVDTEGHDWFILWDFRELLNRVRPVIHAEWFPRMDKCITDLIGFLRYRIYSAFDLTPITIGQSKWVQDVVCVPDERVAAYGLV